MTLLSLIQGLEYAYLLCKCASVLVCNLLVKFTGIIIPNEIDPEKFFYEPFSACPKLFCNYRVVGPWGLSKVGFPREIRLRRLQFLGRLFIKLVFWRFIFLGYGPQGVYSYQVGFPGAVA